MRIITVKPLKEFSMKHAAMVPALERFTTTLSTARWQNIDQVRDVFPHADLVTVKSGRVVTIFNVSGNKCRVIAAIHYNRERAYILGVYTHREYSRGQWKDQL